MKTYIVNLVCSTDRKEYMQKLLQPYEAFDIEFVEAVDGRLLGVEERDRQFDMVKARKAYGRECKPGEVGCTLSHQKCYRRLVEGQERYALILEDDVTLKEEVEAMLPLLERIVDVEQPRIVLLSGGYWYWKRKPIAKGYSLASVYDAYYTSSYLINKSAAELCIDGKPFFLADDWKYLQSKGVRIKACLPHLMEQLPPQNCNSLIFGENEDRGMVKANMDFARCLQMYRIGGMKKMLAFFGGYEAEV